MGTFAISEDTNKMSQNATFHQSLHCLLRQIDLQRKKYNNVFNNYEGHLESS